MKVAVLGGESTVGKSFVARATRHGFNVAQLVGDTTRIRAKRKNLHVYYSGYDDRGIAGCVSDSDVVICMADFIDLEQTIEHCLSSSSVKRLIITRSTKSEFDSYFESVRSKLNEARIDWTIIKYVDSDDANHARDASVEAKDIFVAMHDVAKFIVAQVTDSSCLRSTILLRN